MEKSGTEGQEVIWEAVPYGERGETGVPGLSKNLRRCSIRSGKGSPDGSLQTSGGTTRFFLGSGQE